jgi:UDP-3-O-[3-hydroxymyristoyl] glucosamine N-acyltransferase
MDDISALNLQEVYLCIGVGTNFLREAIYNSIKAHFPRARLPPIVHSTAWVAHNALLGEAAVLLAHSLAGSRATVGIGALLNTGASLDHDSILGSFASLGPGARTGGSVHIGDRAMVGLQAGILQGRTVGQDTVIGAQALVNNDVPELSVAMGIPSTIVRRRERDEPYY